MGRKSKNSNTTSLNKEGQRTMQQKSGTMNVKLINMREVSTVTTLNKKPGKKQNNNHVNKLKFRSPDV